MPFMSLSVDAHLTRERAASSDKSKRDDSGFEPTWDSWDRWLSGTILGVVATAALCSMGLPNGLHIQASCKAFATIRADVSVVNPGPCCLWRQWLHPIVSVTTKGSMVPGPCSLIHQPGSQQRLCEKLGCRAFDAVAAIAYNPSTEVGGML